MDFLQLLVFLFPIKCAAVPTSMGREFRVALPLLMDDGNTDTSGIRFIMTTLARKRVTVFITCPGFEEEPKLNEAVSLLRLAPVEYQIANKYRSEVEIGRKWSYKFMSDTVFALYVLLVVNSQSVDTFLALPTVAWGKQYIAITLSVTPSIQIVSAKADNDVEVQLQFVGISTTINFEGRHYGTNDTLQFKLNVGEAFAISKCRSNQYVSLTGTLVIGSKEIGVISGNCMAQISTTVCHAKQHIANPVSHDIVAEMIPPLVASGLTFILIDMPKRQVDASFYIVGDKDTELTVTYADKVTKITVDYRRVVYLESPQCCSQIKSNKPIQIAFVARPACVRLGFDYQFFVEEPQGDASLAMLVPNELFFVTYAWRTPERIDLYGSFAALVAKSEQILDICLDGGKLYQGLFDWKPVFGQSGYKVGHVTVANGGHVLTSKANIRFGCYIYGLGHKIMYMHPAAIQDCASYPSTQQDVNCDAHFEEETEKKQSTLPATSVTLSTMLGAFSITRGSFINSSGSFTTSSGLLTTSPGGYSASWATWSYLIGFYFLLMTLAVLIVFMIKQKRKLYATDHDLE